MRNPVKYFIWNKEMDFKRGSRYNIEVLNPGIQIAEVENGTGVFYSRLLDAGEKKTAWHRMLVEGDLISEASVEFQIYASENDVFFWKEQKIDIAGLLEDSSITDIEKEKMLKPFCVLTLDNPKDCLLHAIEARFVWFRVQMIAQGELSPKITKIKMIFPKNTWIEYLPDIYMEEKESASFVERYLGMFQSLYEDMTEQIRKIPQYLDFEVGNRAFLKWLAEWISIEDSYLWKEEQLRYLLKNGMELYKKRGTVGYLKEMIKLYTGKEPYVVEYHQLELYMKQAAYAEKLRTLYGFNHYIFTVIVDMDRKITNKEYQVLKRIVELAKPAHMESSVIVLEPYIFLDKHSYLGINSVLGTYGAFVLDGQSSIPFTALTDKEQFSNCETRKFY